LKGRDIKGVIRRAARASWCRGTFTPAFCRQLVDKAVSALGGLDIVVCNAARSSPSINARRDRRGVRPYDENQFYAPFWIFKADDDGIDDVAHVDPSDLAGIVADALVVVDQVQSLEPFLPQLAPGDRERVDDYVRRASADATLRAYKSDWRLFCACARKAVIGRSPATPATVAAFLTLLAESGFSPQELRRTKRGTVLPRKAPVPLGRATIGRRLAAIVFAHRAADVEPPTS
jgi:hypothetical protein